MNIGAICRRDIVTIDAGADLRSAATALRSNHVGALVVTVAHDGHEKVVGMLTDRDLAIEGLARDLAAATTRVAQIASRNVASVSESAPIGDAIAAMHQAAVRRLLVTGPAGQIVGIVSVDDLLDALAGEFSGLAQALRRGISREEVERTNVAAPGRRPVFLPYGAPALQPH